MRPLAHGIELPYWCKGGAARPAAAHLRSGARSIWPSTTVSSRGKSSSGFVLACQSRPLTDDILLDYDKALAPTPIGAISKVARPRRA